MVEIKANRAAWEISAETERIGDADLVFGLYVVGNASHSYFVLQVQVGIGKSYLLSMEIRTINT